MEKLKGRKHQAPWSFLNFFLRERIPGTVGLYPCILKSQAEVHPVHGLFFSEESYPKCKLSLKALQRTTRKAQSLLNLLGDQAHLSVSVCECAWVGEVVLAWEGTGKREERDSTQWICRGDLLCLFSSPHPSFFVLFLRVPLFVPFSSSPSSAFVWEDPGVFFWSTQSFSGTWVLIGWRT